MAKALWIQSVSGTALRLSQVTQLVPRATEKKRIAAGTSPAGYELAAVVGGSTAVVIAHGLTGLADAEAARDALIEQDDEVPGKLRYAHGAWVREERKSV